MNIISDNKIECSLLLDGITVLCERSNKETFLIDKEDLHLISGGKIHAVRDGALFLVKNKITKYLHRAILDPPRDMLVDHINFDKTDCRRSNLRIATHSQNSAHKRILSSIGGRGVYKRKSGRWRATIKKDQKSISIGTYDTIKEAANAFNMMAKKLHGEFAMLNKWGG